MKPLEQPATITCGNGSIAQATIHIKSPSWWWKSRMSNTQGKEKLRERSYKKQMASVTSEVGTTLGATELLKCTDKALVKLRGPTPADRRYILSESSISIIVFYCTSGRLSECLEEPISPEGILQQDVQILERELKENLMFWNVRIKSGLKICLTHHWKNKWTMELQEMVSLKENSTSVPYAGTDCHLHCRYSQHLTLPSTKASSCNPQHSPLECSDQHQCLQPPTLPPEMPGLRDQAAAGQMRGLD